MRKKENNISARGGRISTGPANPALDIITHQPLTQGSGTPSDVRPRTDKEFDKSILLLKDGAGNEASRSASPEWVTENASTISEYGLNIKSSNDDINKKTNHCCGVAHRTNTTSDCALPPMMT